MKDITMTLNDTGRASIAINHEYVKNIVHQTLFTKPNDPYSKRGINFARFKYMTLDQANNETSMIRTNFEKYTEIQPLAVEFQMVESRLIMLMTAMFQEQLLNISIDPDSKQIGFLPV